MGCCWVMKRRASARSACSLPTRFDRAGSCGMFCSQPNTMERVNCISTLARSAPVLGRSRPRHAQHVEKLPIPIADGCCCARGRAHSLKMRASPRPEVLEAQAETPGRLYTGRIRAIAWPVGSQWVASGKPAVGLIHFLLSLPLAYHWLTTPMPTRCPHHPGRLCRTPTPPSHNDSPGAALAFATGQNMPCPALLGTGTVKRGQCGTAR